MSGLSLPGNVHVKFEVRVALTVLNSSARAHTHTHRDTSNENSISAIHFVHLAEINIDPTYRSDAKTGLENAGLSKAALCTIKGGEFDNE